MSNYEESDLQWLCLKANLILDQPLAFTEEKTNCPLKEKLDTAVKKMEFALDKAIMLIEGKYRSKSDQLWSPPAIKSGKKSGKREQIKEDTTTTDASCDRYDRRMSRVFLQRQLWIVNYITSKSSSKNLSNQNIHL